MGKFILGVSVAVIVACGTAFIPVDDVVFKKSDMLNATVRVEGQHGMGSGTIIHSGRDGTYIITNEHVIHEEVYTPTEVDLHGQRIFKDYTKVEVKISNWVFMGSRENAWPVKTTATIVAFDKDKDLALLKVNEPDFQTPYTVHFAENVVQTEPVYVAGSGLGKRTFVTQGMISLTDMGPDKNDMILVSAPIINGNSGGGAFVKRGSRYYLAGVPDAIAVGTIDGKSPYGVVTMGMVIPVQTVLAFLADIKHSDLVKVEVKA